MVHHRVLPNTRFALLSVRTSGVATAFGSATSAFLSGIDHLPNLKWDMLVSKCPFVCGFLTLCMKTEA